MRSLVALIVVAALAPGAAAVECFEQGCVDAWSADAGSCSAGGSERNHLAANTSRIEAHRNFPNASWGATKFGVETFCVRSGEEEYREVRIVASTDPRVEDEETMVLWWSDGERCRLDVMRTAASGEQRVDEIGCPRGSPPPRVPPLLP